MVNGFSYGAEVVVMTAGSAADVVVPVGAWIWPSEICDTPVTVLCALVEAERRAKARETVESAMECIAGGFVVIVCFL